MASSEGARGAPPGPIYALGVLGAWVWFWQQADGFWWHVWAVVQGLFWPAYVVYESLQALR
jgi:hypothetical protein